MADLENSNDVKRLCEDLCQLAGMPLGAFPWLEEVEATPQIASDARMQELITALLVRLIGMEVSVP